MCPLRAASLALALAARAFLCQAGLDFTVLYRSTKQQQIVFAWGCNCKKFEQNPSSLTIRMMMNERVVKCFNSFFCPDEVGQGGWGDRSCVSSCGSSRVLLHVWVRESEASRRGPHFTIPSKHNLQHLGPTANSGLYRRWTSPQHVYFAHGNYVVTVSCVLEIVGTSG